MSFDLTEEQSELVAFLDQLLAQRSDGTAVRAAMQSERGYDVDLWRVLCEEIGAASLAIPESFDGSGFTVFETHLVLEQLGAALTPSPYLASVAISAQALLAADDAESCARLLPEIAAGSRLATLAWADARGRFTPTTSGVRAVNGGGDWVLSGESPLVLDGAIADTILVVASTPDGAGLFEVVDPDGVDRTVTPAVDPTLRFATLRFDDTSARLLSANPDVLEHIRDVALVAITALQVGAAARGLRMTVEYAKQRVQFGRVIGSFQALKHRMADMHVQVETARTASRAAAQALASGEAGAAHSAAVAKAWCSEALDYVASETVQLHGGIAITWEHDAQLVFKRAHALGQLFGTAAEQRTRVADSLGLSGA